MFIVNLRKVRGKLYQNLYAQLRVNLPILLEENAFLMVKNVLHTQV
ncbi:putative peptidase M23B [Acinetobacter baumannii 25493_4]|nr:putative peptidase M23B [Acinetobacter baumannii 25493_4]